VIDIICGSAILQWGQKCGHSLLAALVGRIAIARIYRYPVFYPTPWFLHFTGVGSKLPLRIAQILSKLRIAVLAGGSFVHVS
jgi:hypothetical protein